MALQWIGTDQPTFDGALQDVLKVNRALLVNASYTNGAVTLNGTGYALVQYPVTFTSTADFTLFLRVAPTRVGVAQVFYSATEPAGAYYFMVGVSALNRPYVQYATPSHENPQTYTSDAAVALNTEVVLQIQCGPGAKRGVQVLGNRSTDSRFCVCAGLSFCRVV